MFKMLYRMGQRPLCDTRCYNESKTKVKKEMRAEGQRKRRGTVVGKKSFESTGPKIKGWEIKRTSIQKEAKQRTRDKHQGKLEKCMIAETFG